MTTDVWPPSVAQDELYVALWDSPFWVNERLWVMDNVLFSQDGQVRRGKETAGRSRRNAPTPPPPPTTTKKTVPQTVGPTVEETMASAQRKVIVPQRYRLLVVHMSNANLTFCVSYHPIRLAICTTSPSITRCSPGRYVLGGPDQGGCADRGEAWITVRTSQARQVGLSFDFKFYGHYIRNISISTSEDLNKDGGRHRLPATYDDEVMWVIGYLNTGAYPSFVTDTQYVAPLFDSQLDSSLDTEASVRYRDNGTAFTVEWRRLRLGRPPGVCCFTFQATLVKGGRIVFAYWQVPQEGWAGAGGDIRVGVSDAYKVKKRPAHDPSGNQLEKVGDLDKDTANFLQSRTRLWYREMFRWQRLVDDYMERRKLPNPGTVKNDIEAQRVYHSFQLNSDVIDTSVTETGEDKHTAQSKRYWSFFLEKSTEEDQSDWSKAQANPGQRRTPGPNLPDYKVPRGGRSLETDAIVGILVGMFILIAIIAWTVHICSKKKSEPKVVVVQVVLSTWVVVVVLPAH
ncbi:Plexin domain-containing protein 2 [Branchiostoma belcheri]|nr:Plexin domain-containing protein 2 [Branchiostoma belcheri]